MPPEFLSRTTGGDSVEDRTSTLPDVQEFVGQKDWLSVKDLQAELGIGPGLAYRLVNSGRIPSVRIHGLIRIHRPTMERTLLEEPLGEELRHEVR
jgi:hypothetical protein